MVFVNDSACQYHEKSHTIFQKVFDVGPFLGKLTKRSVSSSSNLSQQLDEQNYLEIIRN